MKLIFFDITPELVEEAKRLHKYGIQTELSDVSKLLDKHKPDFIVSPANSFGWMDGGIDGVYSRIFKGIQDRVQADIAKYNVYTPSGKLYLPVGSAITVETGSELCPCLISAPTMYFPSNIRNTNNVFMAFLAILHIAKSNPEKTVVCPGLGTGVGMLSPKIMIDQMIKALEYYPGNLVGTKIEKSQRTIVYRDTQNIVYSG